MITPIAKKMVDFSSWLTIRDLPKFCQWLVDEGIEVACLRLGNGSKKDSRFDEFYDALKIYAPSIRISVYYWPNELYSAQTSADYILGFLGEREIDFIASDIESPYYSGSWSLLKNKMFEIDQILKHYFGDIIFVYTSDRATTLMGADSRYPGLKIWNAVWYSSNPLKFPSGDSIPWRVPRYTTKDQCYMWQFFQKWAGLPTSPPYSSSSIDCNVTYQEAEYLFLDELTDPDPDPDPEIEVWVTYKVLANSLRVRSGAGVEFPEVSYLYKDQEGWVRNFGVDTVGNFWVEISIDRWAALTYGGVRLLDITFIEEPIVFDEPQPEPTPEPPAPEPPAPEPPAPEPQPEPDEPSDPNPTNVGNALIKGRETKDWSVAWAITTYNNRIPVIETNVFAATNNQTYYFSKGEEIRVFKDVVISDGGIKWHQVYGMFYEDGPVFIRKDEMMKLW